MSKPSRYALESINRWRRLSIPKNAHRFTKLFLELCNDQRIDMQSLADRSGVPVKTIRNWKQRYYNPQLANIEAVLDVLGYELVARKKVDDGTRPLPLQEKVKERASYR